MREIQFVKKINRVGVKEAAEITGLSQHELRQGVKSGKYPFSRTGKTSNGKILFDIDFLLKHIEQMMLNNIN